MTERFDIDWQPLGRHVTVPAGTTLLEAAQSAGVELVAVCGGMGTCSTCRVRVMDGELSPVTANEDFELGEAVTRGYRLACQAAPLSAVRLAVPPESLATPQRTQTEGIGVAIALDPIVTPIEVTLPPPDFSDLRSDSARLLAAIGPAAHSIDYAALIDLSDRLRANQWAVRAAVRDRVVMAVRPAHTPLLGLAVDVGTTKLAAYLIDLASGATLARIGAMNPQIAYGEDVISRIAYATQKPAGRATLQRTLIEALNTLVDELCAASQAARGEIVEAVIVGNTAMHHLLAGLPVQQLGTAPYVPAVGAAVTVRASDLGLKISPAAQIYLPPNIAGFVGADHVAMLLGAEVWNTARTVVAIDIGTNTEISVAHAGQLVCCSCASGPAFEGAHITAGMRAAPGAIERVQLIDDAIHLHTIGRQPPVGICGSGILDVMAELLKAGVLDRRGTLRRADARVQLRSGKAEFILVDAAHSGHGREVVVSRGDVNEIQLAKSAIRVGIDVLLAESGVRAADVDEFIVAGAFGTYLDVGSAIRIGLFPDLPRERFKQVGNAAGTGARQLLLSAERRRIADEVAQRDRYIELTTYPDFTARFVAAMYF